jgi:5-methylcytosine-specific restriction endonuclease McrA
MKGEMKMAKILQLDIDGQPKEWISWQDAAVYHAKGQVSWSLGEFETVIRGGNNRITGEQSIIKTSSIIAIKGAVGKRRHTVPSLNNTELFRRDRCTCAYCGHVFSDSKLTRDHIIPKYLKGQDIWMNVVTCCGKCNQKKDCKTLEEAGLTLLYAPYIPSKAEHLILANRHILADQMEFLMAFVDKKSRLHQEVVFHQ